MTAENDASAPGSHDDIDAWLDRLSRGPRTDVLTPLTEESAMRRAILNFHQPAEESLLASAKLADDDHAWQHMQFRLKREGLMAMRPAWRVWVPAAAAAMLLAAVVVPKMLHGPGNDVVLVSYGEPPKLRGGFPEVASAEALEVAQQLATHLRKFDPAVRLFWYEGSATIDFEANAEQLEAIVQLIKPDFPNVKLRAGWNRLVFTQKK